MVFYTNVFINPTCGFLLLYAFIKLFNAEIEHLFLTYLFIISVYNIQVAF